MTPVIQFTERIIRNVETVIVGKRQQIEWLMVALLCQGHVFIEDVPGTSKTMLARAIAASMGILCPTFDHEQDRRVRAIWKRVRAALQALKRKADAELVVRRRQSGAQR